MVLHGGITAQRCGVLSGTSPVGTFFVLLQICAPSHNSVLHVAFLMHGTLFYVQVVIGAVLHILRFTPILQRA